MDGLVLLVGLSGVVLGGESLVGDVELLQRLDEL